MAGPGLDDTEVLAQPRAFTRTAAAEAMGGAPGRYRVLELLGAGGGGRVFRAYDEVLRRHVALKLLDTRDADHGRQLLREAQAQARVEHENVCKVYAIGDDATRPFI